MLAGILIFTSASLAVYLFISGWLDRRLARRLELAAQTERTRGVWAQAREALFALVRDGKLDIRSETFRVFYGLQTFIMRRPDAYEEFSRKLARGFLAGPKKADPPWTKEQSQWPEGMTRVLELMTEGFKMLAFEYASGRRILIRFVAGFLLRIAPWMAVHVGARALRSAGRWVLAWKPVQVERQLRDSYLRAAQLAQKLPSAGYAH